jgi:hypothetical protein
VSVLHRHVANKMCDGACIGLARTINICVHVHRYINVCVYTAYLRHFQQGNDHTFPTMFKPFLTMFKQGMTIHTFISVCIYGCGRPYTCRILAGPLWLPASSGICVSLQRETSSSLCFRARRRSSAGGVCVCVCVCAWTGAQGFAAV